MSELRVSESTARRRIEKVIPEGRDAAVDFDGGSIWLEPHGSNRQGGKTVCYEADFTETEAESEECEMGRMRFLDYYRTDFT